MKNNKVKGTSATRNVTRNDPNEASASKLILESLNDIASGKQNPQPKLQEAEDLLKKAIEAQK